jgi:hypothetical protein
MTVTTTHLPPTPGRRSRPTGPNAWLVIGGVGTAILLIAGALSVAGWLGYRTEVQSQVYHQSIATIDIDIATGDLVLSPGEPDTVSLTRRLHWSYTKPTVEEHWDGQTLRVTGACRGVSFGPNCGVDYTVAVPPGIAIRAHTSTGDVLVRDLHGELQLSTDTGDIIASNSVTASADTGDITLSFSAPPQAVSAGTDTGDVTLAVPPGDDYHVQAQTDTGDVGIAVQQNEGSARSITARTNTGDINISYS